MNLATRLDISLNQLSASRCVANTIFGAARSETARCNTPRTLAESTSSACVPPCAAPANNSDRVKAQGTRYKLKAEQQVSLVPCPLSLVTDIFIVSIVRASQY